MSRPARPRGAQETDQVNPIRDSYVKACWGNLKMAALLNHLMFLAKCKAKNESREISKIETLEISREDLAKKVHIAPGTLVTFLQKFVDAQYVISKAYSPLFEVNTEAVEQAAINPPTKPERKPAQPRGKKISKIDNSGFPIDIMLDKFSKLETYFSNLEIGIAKLETKLSILEEKIAKLEIWKSLESTPEEAGEGYFPAPSITSSLSNESNKENIAPDAVSNEQDSGFAIATPQGDEEQASNSYSQGLSSTIQNTLFGDGVAYRKNEDKPALETTSEQKPTKEKIELTPDQMEQCRRWYTHFEKVHGEPFEGKGEIVNVRKYIKMLVLKYDETTIMRIYKHLSEKDFKWSKPSFKFKITPYVMYDNASSVLQQLANPEASETQEHKHKGSPNAPLLDEQVIKERTARNIEERKARIAAREAQKAAMA